jgi:hypothetical protein
MARAEVLDAIVAADGFPHEQTTLAVAITRARKVHVIHTQRAVGRKNGTEKTGENNRKRITTTT